MLTRSVGFFLSLLSRISSFFLGKCIPDTQLSCICFSQEADFYLLYGSHERPLSVKLSCLVHLRCVSWANHSLPVPISRLSVMDLRLGHRTQPASEGCAGPCHCLHFCLNTQLSPPPLEMCYPVFHYIQPGCVINEFSNGTEESYMTPAAFWLAEGAEV